MFNKGMPKSNATIMQNGCASLAAYNFTDTYANSTRNFTSCCNSLTACYQGCVIPPEMCNKRFSECVEKVVKRNSQTTTAAATTESSSIKKYLKKFLFNHSFLLK